MAFDMESVAEATSGAFGALVSTSILYPLDTCKTKYQAEVRGPKPKYSNLSDVLWEAISRRQVLSLYQGLATKNLISQFAYFYSYSYFKRLYLVKSGSKSIGTKANLIIASAAGACTVIITQDANKCNWEVERLWKTLSEGTRREAFAGLGISLLLTANPTIQYTVFDQLKLRLLEGQHNSHKRDKESSQQVLSAFSAFVLGAVSKCVATCLTYPAIRCKVMIQSAESDEVVTANAKTKSEKTFLGALCTIWKLEGIPGFFKGLDAQILKTVLSSALLLMIKEKITKATCSEDFVFNQDQVEELLKFM